MNTLSTEKKKLVLSHLVEGISIRSTERITGVHQNTIMSLLVKAGENAAAVLDLEMRDLHCQHLQLDEMWTWCYKRQQQCTNEEKAAGNVGDQWIFVAIDADTKLIPSFLVGKRTSGETTDFVSDLGRRVVSKRVQITTDGFVLYRDAIFRSSFWNRSDCAMEIKHFSGKSEEAGRYAPQKVVSVQHIIVRGNPDPDFISTSFVERQNLTLRTCQRRFSRLTNAFSKKRENLIAAVNLHFYWYNMMRIHETLRMTPAMASDVTNHIWGWEPILS